MSLLISSACLRNPQLAKTNDLFDELATERAMLAEAPPRVDDSCASLGRTSSRIYGEPGLADVRPVWPELRDGARALQAVCGQAILLAQPSTDSPSVLEAHQRWRDGIQREMGVSCDHLRAAAAALNRAAPC